MPSSSVRALVGLALAGLVTSSVVPMASAHQDRKGGSHADGRVVASGLDSPRHLSAASNGDLYVAEAGAGGTDCVGFDEVDENGDPVVLEVCAGTSGAVTKVTRRGHQSRVVEGLPSVMLGEGEIAGPSDVATKGSTLMISIGLGGPPEARDAFVAEHGKAYQRLATVQSARLKGKKAPRLRTEADLARFETRNNPHPAVLDTNPNSIARDKNGWLIADAGGNDVVRLDHRGRLRLVTVLPDGEAVAPPFLPVPPGTLIPFEAVPTAAERGPDGAVYVSQLTGFPFPQGGSSIWRISRDGTARMWATGLTNVTDLALDRKGNVYAVQLSDAGLLAETGVPMGSLVRIDRRDRDVETIATELLAPYGVALHKGNAYVTTCTVCVDAGQVLKFDLDD